jgi:type I restriction enzyme S subunit
MSALPEGWVSLTLEEVGVITTGNTPPTKQPDNYSGNIPFVKPGDLDTQQPITNTEQTLSEQGVIQARVLRPGAVLVSCIGNLGKIGFAGVPLATNQQINSIEFEPSLVEDRYGYHYCKTLRPWMEEQASATTVTILNKGKFSKAPFVLAPLAEQKRIADKLDALLARVDGCRARLARVPAILKRFRQAVLAAATSGALTAEWRDEQQTSINDWQHLVFGEACNEITVGFVGKMADQYRDQGIPFLRSLNVRPFRFDSNNLQFISPEFHKQIGKSKLRPGDVVVVRTGAPGQSCVIPHDLKEANCSDLVIVRPGKNLVSEYACIFINSSQSQEFVRSEIVGVAQAHFNVGSMKVTPLSLPPLEEQHEIVRRVETLFGYADRLEARYTAALTRVERLTPALLAKAFRGELVAQDSADEPAGVLLERVQAARGAMGESRARRRPGID